MTRIKIAGKLLRANSKYINPGLLFDKQGKAGASINAGIVFM